MSVRLTRHHARGAVVLGGVLLAAIAAPAVGLVSSAPLAGPEPARAEAAAQLPEPAPLVFGPAFPVVAGDDERRYLAWAESRARATAELTAAVRAEEADSAGRGDSPDVDAPIPTTGVTQKSAQIQDLVRRHFPADQLGNAMAVAACESGHSDAIGATNSDGTTDWGVFQLNDGGTLQAALNAIGVEFDSVAQARRLALRTEINVRAAASIYADRGWAPWVCAYKIGVVAGLYSSAPGPMDGKFDEWGKPTVPVPVVEVDPGTTDSTPEPDREPRREPQDPDRSGDPAPESEPEPEPTAEPSRSPRPSPEPSQPAPSPSATPSATPSARATTPAPERSTPAPQQSAPAPARSATPS